MLKVLLIFIILSAQPLFLISRLKQRFEIVLPVCCMFDTLILTVFGMVFKNLTAGVIIVCFLAALSLIAAVFFERNALTGFLIKVATPGFFAWCVGYCLMWAFSYKQFLVAWDDFMHWGVFVKQMVFHNKLYAEPDVQIIMHKYYPPAVPLFEYMFTRIWGSYNESVILAASKILLYAAVLPFTKIFDKKESFKAVLLSLTVFLSLFFWVAQDLAVFSLCLDAHLSVIFALYVYLAVFDNKNPLRAVNCCVTGVFLTLTKVTGFEFALVGMGVYLCIWLVSVKKEEFFKRSVINVLKKAGVAFLWALPIIAYFIWNAYTANIPPEVTLGAPAGSVFRWLTLNGGEGKSNILSADTYRWVTMNMTSGRFSLYNPAIVAVYIVIMYCLKKTEKDRALFEGYNVLMILLPLGYILYSFSLIAFRVINGVTVDRNGLQGFDRYLASYVAGMFLVFLFSVLRKASVLNNENALSRRLTACTVFIIVLIMLQPWVFQNLGPFGNDGYDASEYKNYTKIVQKFQDYAAAANVKNTAQIYIVHCDSVEELYWKCQYFLRPSETNAIMNQNANNSAETYYPVWRFQDGMDWGLLLAQRGFTHVFLNDVNEEFKMKYYRMFGCAYDQIRPDTLYQVAAADAPDMPVRLLPVDVPVYTY